MQDQLDASKDMDDEFAEWDRFDALYESSLTADVAFERYKKQRAELKHQRHLKQMREYQARKRAQRALASVPITRS